MKNKIIVGLDLGTTKVCVVIAEELGDDRFKVLGFGIAPSEGLSKGLVANISKTAEAIKEAVAIASNRAGLEVQSLNVGVAGEHITSLRHRNYVTITNEEHEITKEDLFRLESDVRTIPIPSDRQILHIIPEEFFVDYNGGIENPIGMTGSRLEAANHIVLASIPAIQNIRKSVERAGFLVSQYILQPIASCSSVLYENEKDLGVLLIDIGGGTTDIAIIHKKAIKHSKVFGVAGNQVTNDIRESLGIVTNEAEALKKLHGYASEATIIKDEEIIIKGVGGKANTKIPTSLLTQIIGMRMSELFTLIDNDIRSVGLKTKLKGGIVITGGGSMLRGCTELAEEVFGLPCRMGIPLEFSTGAVAEMEKPEFATVVGLIKGIPGSKNAPEIPVITKKKKAKKNKAVEVWKNFRNFFDEL